MGGTCFSSVQWIHVPLPAGCASGTMNNLSMGSEDRGASYHLKVSVRKWDSEALLASNVT